MQKSEFSHVTHSLFFLFQTTQLTPECGYNVMRLRRVYDSDWLSSLSLFSCLPSLEFLFNDHARIERDCVAMYSAEKKKEKNLRNFGRFRSLPLCDSRSHVSFENLSRDGKFKDIFIFLKIVNFFLLNNFDFWKNNFKSKFFWKKNKKLIF
jgi:hypothetical protein